jgi:hypothetical protein
MKYVRNVCQLESSTFFDGVNVCVCERTNGNFNASVTTNTASSSHSCEYKQWTDSMNV